MAPKMRRPAASAPRARPRHRPAAEREEDLPVERLYSWSDLTLERLGALDVIELDRASYYNASVHVAGRVRALHPGEGRMDFTLTGTQSERVMEAFGGGEDRTVKVHLCKEDCAQLETGLKLFHARGFWDCAVAPKEWQMNLSEKAVAEFDELSSLRRLAEERGKGRGGEKPPKAKEAEPGGVEGEKKEGKEKDKKRKKVKERKAEKEWEEKLEAQERDETLERGQKTARAIFSGTCLDPNVSRRRRLMRRARKLKTKSDKKRKRSSSTEDGESSSTDTSEEEVSDDDAPLFEETRRVKRLHAHYPGALTMQALDNMREHLMTARGDLYSSSREQLAPIFAIYAYQHLKPHASPVLWQEMNTIAQVSDLLLRRKVASALDILVQRAKSLEATLKGGHYTVSRQLELVGADQVAIAEAGENYEAARHAREDFRNKSLGSKPHGMGRKGDNEGKNRGKAVPSSEPAYRDKGEKGKKGKSKWERKGKTEG